jgi:hypothetical protein
VLVGLRKQVGGAVGSRGPVYGCHGLSLTTLALADFFVADLAFVDIKDDTFLVGPLVFPRTYGSRDELPQAGRDFGSQMYASANHATSSTSPRHATSLASAAALCLPGSPMPPESRPSRSRPCVTFWASLAPCTPSRRTGRARPSSRRPGRRCVAPRSARKAPAVSLGGKAALKRAEDATDRLCAIVAGDVLRLVHATAGRVRRGIGPARPRERP